MSHSCVITGLLISTHDLTRRSTFTATDAISIARHFNSRPHKEVDVYLLYKLRQTKRISTHDLTRRSTEGSTSPATQSVFQLTTSQGGRHNASVQKLAAKAFQLTTSQGGRHQARKESTTSMIFQLTTSQGGRQYQP